MSDRVYRSVSAPGVVQGFRAEPSSTTERKGSFVTVETVVLWLVYAFMIAGNAFVEATQFAGTTSASVAYSTFTWFTPAGYVFSIWSVIYVALFIWLVAYTRRAAKRSPGFTPMSVLFIVSSGLNVLWLVIWHLQMLELALVFLWAVVGVGVHVLEVSNTVAMVVFALAFVGAVLIFAPLGKLRSKASQ